MTSGSTDYSMLGLFRSELEIHAAALSDGLLALETQPGAGGTEVLMRAAHSIKGAARIVQLSAIEKLAHIMEDCFVAVKEQSLNLTADHIDTLLSAVDLFVQLAGIGESEMPTWVEGQAAQIEDVAAGVAAVFSGPDGTPPADRTGEPAVSPAPPPDAPPAPQPPPERSETVPMQQDGATSQHDRFVRVSADNLNRLMGLTGEFLVQSRWMGPFAKSMLRLKKGGAGISDALQRLDASFSDGSFTAKAVSYLAETGQKTADFNRLVTENINEFELFARRIAKLSNDLHQEVIRSRMRPFSDGVQGFARMVRDTARDLGKKVRLEIRGKQIEVDRDILEKLEAPLNHMLRNAIDHGIEPPDERRTAGKSEEGVVRIEAGHRAGMLTITVSDDGRGIDIEKLREKVVERKMISDSMAGDLSRDELLEFLFLPGFTTARSVTDISGRGVGLDVVHSMIKDVGGSVRVDGEPGSKTAFHLKLPLTLSVIRTLIVDIAGEQYAFPLVRIERCLQVPIAELKLLEDRQYITVEGTNIGLIDAHQVLEFERTARDDDVLPVVVIGDGAERYGIVVDRFYGERDLVVQPLDHRLGKIADISAAAILGDGSPVLIVDVEDMLRTIHTVLSGQKLRKIGAAPAESYLRRRKSILVVDDSITVRETERKILENSGYDVDLAVNGMDGWNAARSGGYDLIVTDIDMPRMDGFEFTRLVKQDNRLKDLPVIIVSYKERKEDRLRGLEAGANYYLTKSSFHDDTFLKAVVDLIGRDPHENSNR